ncbi:MAG: hypothetical protein KI785_03575 [Devosiaceae bacterium]|nr:hypothetical protein [Devosiaceae bacterium MH13]
MKIVTAALAASLIAAAGAPALASSYNETHKDVTVVSVDRSGGALQVQSFGVTKTLDMQNPNNVFIPMDVTPGDTLRLTSRSGSLSSVRVLSN